MSVIKFCMLILLVDCHHHFHFHSSLQVLASSTKGEWEMRAWIQLPVKLVSFRHSNSKFYLSHLNPVQFPSYKKSPSDIGSPRNQSKPISSSHPNGSDITNIHFENNYNQKEDDPSSKHYHWRHQNGKHDAFDQAVSIDSKVPKPGYSSGKSANDLINANVGSNSDFLPLNTGTPVSVSLDTVQLQGCKNDSQRQGESNGSLLGRNVTSFSTFQDINSSHSQKNNIVSKSSDYSNFNLSNDSRPPVASRESKLSSPNSLLKITTLIYKNMSQSELSYSTEPAQQLIPTLSKSGIRVKNQEQKMLKAMHFYESISSPPEGFTPGRHTSSKPLRSFRSSESKLPTPVLSSFPISSPTSFLSLGQVHFKFNPADPHKFTSPLKHPQTHATTSTIEQGPVGEERKLRKTKKRRSSKQEVILTNNKYLSTKWPVMNNSAGDFLEDEPPPEITTRSDVPPSSPDTLNYSFLLYETTAGQDFLFTTPQSTAFTNTHEEKMKNTNSEESLENSSKPLEDSLEEGRGKSIESERRVELIRNFEASHPVKVWAAVGFYDEAYLETVNTHWLQFEPGYPIVHKIMAIVYGIIMVVGCFGNLLVIFMFFRCRSLRTPPNYLILNLAISDCLMMLKMPVFIYNSLFEGPALGLVGCKIYGFVGGLSGTASIMTLATISLDRYYVIVFPMNPMKRTTSARALMMMSIVWLYSAFFSSIPLLGLNGYVSEGYLTSCSFDYLSDKTADRVFVFVFFLAAFVLPLSIIVFSYTGIFRIVRAAERVEFFCSENGNGAPLTRESFKYKQDQKKHKTEYKIAILSSTIILIWLLAWTPYAIIALLGIFGYKELLTPFVSCVPAMFCKTASCVDPFLYAINHPRFQRELRNKFKVCYFHKKRRNSPDNSYYSNTREPRSENNSMSLRRKPSPPTARESPASSLKTPKCSSNNTSMIVCFKDLDSPRVGKLSRNSSPLLEKKAHHQDQYGNAGELHINDKDGKKFEIRIIGKNRFGQISSLAKNCNGTGNVCCDEDKPPNQVEDIKEKDNNTLVDEISPDSSKNSGRDFQDSRDLRMNDVTFSNIEGKELSTVSYNRCSPDSESGTNINLNCKVLNLKSLSAESTTTITTIKGAYKLETTIM